MLDPPDIIPPFCSIGDVMAKASKPKRKDVALEVRTFKGASGKSYLVFKTLGGSYHTFEEVESKAVAKDCGAMTGGKNTRQMWKSIWI